ncbi:hypothetical protein Ancab_004711 [Ancistrocladus abbreviatus]
MVMHEESNQYYYWNTVTVETSWAVPNDMVAATMLTGGDETFHAEEKDGVFILAVQPVDVLNEGGDKSANEVSATVVACEHGSQIDQSVEVYVGDADQFINGSVVAGAWYQQTVLGNYSSYKPPNCTVVSGVGSTCAVSVTTGYGTLTSQLDETDLPSH